MTTAPSSPPSNATSLDTHSVADLHVKETSPSNSLAIGQRDPCDDFNDPTKDRCSDEVPDPTADDPTADDPTADDPTADDPTADDPTAADPTADTTPTPPMPPPEDAPMPPPETCLQKHLGATLCARLQRYTKEEQQPLWVLHSPLDMAVNVEQVERAVKPHKTMLTLAQNMMGRRGGRVRHTLGNSGAKRQDVIKIYDEHSAKYKEANDTFLDARQTLRSTVRDFLNGLDDAAHTVAVQRLADKKPFSKGVIRHFWAAVRSDDPVKLFKTLYSEDMVRRADYAIYRENRLPGDLVSRPLMDLLTKGGHPLVPDGGAQRCAAALREKYSVAV